MVDRWAAVWATLLMLFWVAVIVLDVLALERWTEIVLIANFSFAAGGFAVVLWRGLYQRFRK